MSLHILSIGAHPDDSEHAVGGTAALFRARGDEVRFVSVTDGSKGHYLPDYIADPDSLVRRRYQESLRATGVIGASYETMRIPDGEVYVTPANTEEMVRLIRSFGEPGQGPDLVLLNRPTDYHRDHRYSAQLVLDATYMLTVPPMCPDTRHLDRMPVFAYWHDRFTEGGEFRADIVIPIDRVMETKIDLVCAHESQFFEWIPFNMGVLDQVPRDYEARREWLGDRYRKNAASVAAKYADRLPPGTQYAEAFQLSEYGRMPTDEEIEVLFPIDG
jgi:LmbE family N-acetylglucosaminyl deacetylase